MSTQTPQIFWQPLSADKISGMLHLHALGDALGGPHEVYRTKAVYTGKLESPIVRLGRHYGKRVSAVGQVTDDTEMTICLARSLAENGGYNRDDVLLKYMAWASQPATMEGHTTRALFSGVKTVRGYEARFKRGMEGTLKGMPKITKDATLYDIQSNGSLMRVAPLAVLPGYDGVTIDTYLTNPNPVNLDINYIYVTALQQLARMNVYSDAMSLSELYATLTQLAQTDLSQQVFADLESGVQRDITGKDKGWVRHAFYCAMYVLARLTSSPDDAKPSYSILIGEVIMMGGDTDTNGAIAGAIIGAYYGHDYVIRTDETTSQNLKIMVTVTSEETAQEHVDPTNPEKYYTGWPREEIYTADNIELLATALAALYN